VLFEENMAFCGKADCLRAYLRLDEAITKGLLGEELGEGSGLD